MTYKNIIVTDSFYNGFSKDFFRKLLENRSKDSIFIFNEQLDPQEDGAPMGGCVSTTLANLILGYHEKFWLNNCPAKLLNMVHG